MALRWLAPALALAFLTISPGWGTAKDGDLVFEFSTDPVVSEQIQSALDVRPNTSQSFYLYVRNKSDDKRVVRVEILTADGRQKLAESRFNLTQTVANKANPVAVRVNLTKPAPPMPAPPAGAPQPAPMPLAPMPMATPMPMAPPPPPGIELKPILAPDMKSRRFVFRVRAYDDRTEAEATASGEPEKPSEDLEMVVGIYEPIDYVKPQETTFRRDGRTNMLKATFKTEANFKGTAPCPVELQFPPQRGVKVDAMRESVFRRTLTGPNQVAPLYTRNMPLTGLADTGIFYINIDGVPRAYVYRHSFATETGNREAVVEQMPDASIRFMEANQAAVPTEILTKPRVLPIRIEADTTLANAPIELRLKQLPSGDNIEVIAREEKRERHAYLEAAAADGGLLVTSRVSDWVVPLDLKDLRGRYLLQAVLKNPDPNKEPLATFDAPLAVDDTRPEEVRLEVMPGKLVREKDGTIKHLRTLPVPVQVFAHDPESDIEQVVVFFGKVGPDGKLPEKFVRATRPALPGAPWLAALPLPEEPPAPPPMPNAPPMVPPPPKTPDITAVAVNGVGIPSDPVTVRIQLIDPPPPPTTGTIKGTITMSLKGKGLPGVQVILFNNERKEVGAAKTDDKGVYTIENVQPGTYIAVATRPDSGVGTKGETTVRVEAGKIADGSIMLSRRP